MNKVYKHIRSKTLGCLVVVSEESNGSRGNKTGRRKLAPLISSSVLIATPVFAQSVLPVDGKIVSGQGAIVANGNTMTIRQSTDRMIANWQSFSIGKDAVVTFHQPDASSVALNRVVGQTPTQILGSLNANGQVFLVNPNGVVIGQSGSVQAGAFVASTLSLTDEDFLAGRYHFSGEGRAIVNQGNIKGNVVALIAPSVLNEGSIKGNTALAAGTDALLDFDGDGLLSIQVKASTLATLVENKGLIQADGGRVILTAKGASDALKGIVNNSGTVQAHTIARTGGRILLLGDMEHGETNIAGTLDASAPHGGDGGFIETSAAKVKIAGEAKITTRAENGKTGDWLIDPNDFTIAASGGNITGSALSTQLASSNVTISTVTQGTSGGNGDITVNDTVSWSANTLTLHAERNIAINSAMTGSATAGLALEYGQSAVASGNTATYTVNTPVTLASTGSFSTKLGSDGAATNYTVVTSLGTSASSNDGTLQGIAGNLSGNYVLGADIDASSTSSWNSNAGFSPIGTNSTGTSASRFSATFDGLGHVITGLTINQPSTNFVGLFGYVETSGVVRNVGLSGGSVTGSSRVGQLAGAVNGTISSSYTTGSVSAADNAGGLVGKNFGTITTSYATGSVSGQSSLGGLAGLSQGGTITYSYATGNVTASDATSQAGGLVGYLNGGTISNSYATGQVSGNTNVGGLLGFHNSGTVNQTYATGAVTGSGTATVGGLVGFANAGTTVSNSYWDTSTTGRSIGCGTATSITCGTTGLATTSMTNPFTFTDGGWNLGSIWGKSQSGGNNGYMVLRALNSTVYDDYVKLSNTNLSKTYGDANPSLSSITLSGAGTSNVTLSWGSAITTASNVGSYSYGTANVLSVTDSSGRSAYTDYGSGALTINKAALTATATDATKTYDKQAFSGGNGVSYSGFANSDNSSVISGTVSFGGTAQGAVNVGSYSLIPSGLSAQNYDITYVNGTLTVNKAAISAITGITASNKTYDSTTAATLNTSNAAFTGIVSGDTLSLASASGAFADKNAGTGKTVNITGLTLGGADVANYSLASSTATTTANITQATISAVTGVTASNKTYDGTTTASLNTSNAAFTGIISGDTLSVASASGTFGDKNAGTGKTVNITGLTLGGADVANYSLASSTATTTANITQATISAVTGITASNKTYDGTTAATLNTSNAAFTGIVSGDTLSVASASGAFADKNAETGKTVNITGLTLGGADVANYSLASSTATTTANITQATISAVTGITASNKTYDGTTTASLNTGNAAFTGLISGDTLSVASASGAFTDKNAGTGKTVNITGISLGGADAGNYNLTSTATTSAANINKAALTATANDVIKTYDGQAFSGGNGISYSGFVNGDNSSTLSGTLSFGITSQGARNVGSYTLIPSGLSAQNYDITYANGTLTINKAAISAITGITASNKTYDGTTAATLNTSNAAFTGIVSGDTLSVASASGIFTDKNAGTGKTVNITGLTLGGTDAANYSLASSTATTTANITQATISAVTGITASNKTYDGTTTTSLNTDNAAFTGLISGDTLSVASASSTFANKNAGTGKIVNITGISLSGADVANYNLASTISTTTADITRATISAVSGVTANNKTYDGTTAVTLNTGNAAFTGMIAGDTLNISFAEGNFVNANPGMDKTVFIKRLTLGGADASNYVLANTTATASASINAILVSPLSPEQIATGHISIIEDPFTTPDLIREEANAALIPRVENKIVNSAHCSLENNQRKASHCNP